MSATAAGISESQAEQLLLQIQSLAGATDSQWRASFDADVVGSYLTMCLADTSADDAEAVDDVADTLTAYIPCVEGLDRSQLIDCIREFVLSLTAANSRTKTDESMMPGSPTKNIDLTISQSDLAPAASCVGSNKAKKKSATATEIDPPDAELSKIILDKHFMVSDTAVHVPSAAMLDRPTEQKNKTRYRDGQVVSTKGGRFLEEKKENSEEMKKTYINLKPLRKYRFH